MIFQMLIQAPNLTLTLLIVHTFEEQQFKMAAIFKDGRHKKYVSITLDPQV